MEEHEDHTDHITPQWVHVSDLGQELDTMICGLLDRIGELECFQALDVEIRDPKIASHDAQVAIIMRAILATTNLHEAYANDAVQAAKLEPVASPHKPLDMVAYAVEVFGAKS